MTLAWVKLTRNKPTPGDSPSEGVEDRDLPGREEESGEGLCASGRHVNILSGPVEHLTVVAGAVHVRLSLISMVLQCRR